MIERAPLHEEQAGRTFILTPRHAGFLILPPFRNSSAPRDHTIPASAVLSIADRAFYGNNVDRNLQA
ncbi:MAG: hypothetical protein C4293_22420 [Nitrospiraceae bacterium]